MSPKTKQKEVLKQLKKLTKKALYKMASFFDIQGRSTMKKAEIIEVFEKKKFKPKDIQAAVEKVITQEKKKDKKNVETKHSDKKKMKTKKGLPEEKQFARPESAITSAVIPEEPAKVVEEPSVWLGEEGPDLPTNYNTTLLKALPRDPHWAFVYWEISEETREALLREEGEWFFDVTTPILTVFDENNNRVQEIPVLLDTKCWYVCLPPSKSYSFELGLKRPDGSYRMLIRSNAINLPPIEPGAESDAEEWAIIEERYEELLRLSGGIDITAIGGSGTVVPHILRHRDNVLASMERQFIQHKNCREKYEISIFMIN